MKSIFGAKVVKSALVFGLALGCVVSFSNKVALADFDPRKAGWRDTLLAVGEEAPNFSLTSTLGENVSLSKYRGKKMLVLYFYPRDFSPGCTREAEAFAKDYALYERRNAAVVGISVDAPQSQKNFAAKLSLPYPLLSDQGGAVAHQYGVMGWIMAKRVTFIIGIDGHVKQVFPEVDVEDHSRDILRSLGETTSAIPSKMAPDRKSKR